MVIGKLVTLVPSGTGGRNVYKWNDQKFALEIISGYCGLVYKISIYTNVFLPLVE